MPGILQVHSTYTIKRLEPSVAEESLGVFILADGNWQRQIEELKEKAEVFARQIKREVIMPKDAWYTFTHSFLPSLNYCMPAVSIPKDKWDEIMKIVLGPVLQKLGTVSVAAHNLVYSTRRLQGFGVYHPYYFQNISQLGIVVSETCN